MLQVLQGYPFPAETDSNVSARASRQRGASGKEVREAVA